MNILHLLIWISQKNTGFMPFLYLVLFQVTYELTSQCSLEYVQNEVGHQDVATSSIAKLLIALRADPETAA